MHVTAFRPAAMWRDICCGAFFCAFALIGFGSVMSSPPLINSLGAGLDPGPALLPLVVLSLMLVGGSLILAKGLLRWWRNVKQPTQLTPQAPEKAATAMGQHLHAAALLAALVLLPSMIQWFGFLPAALAVTTPWLIWLGYRRTRQLRHATLFGCLISGLLCISLYLIFITLLDVPL